VSESGADAHAGLGLFASLRRLLTTLVELVHERLDLVGIELQLEVQRAASLLLWAFAGIVCGFVALVLLAVTVLIAFWDTHRLLAAGCITAVFALASLGMALHVRHRLRTRPRVFGATLDELQHDVAALKGPQP
jgi:uncharacterized membrane protein YqjE